MVGAPRSRERTSSRATETLAHRHWIALRLVSAVLWLFPRLHCYSTDRISWELGCGPSKRSFPECSSAAPDFSPRSPGVSWRRVCCVQGDLRLHSDWYCHERIGGVCGHKRRAPSAVVHFSSEIGRASCRVRVEISV